MRGGRAAVGATNGLRSRLLLGVALAFAAVTPWAAFAAGASGAATPHATTPPPAGSVLAWGDNTVGALGIGNATGPDTCSSQSCSWSPIQASLPGGALAASVTSHHFSSLAITTTGALLSWGANVEGQLGLGTTTGPETCASSTPCSTSPLPVSLPAGTIVTADATGHSFDLAVTNTGNVYAWGNNSNGQLGQGNTNPPSSSPLQVPLPAGVRVVAVAAGHDTSYALTSTGGLYAWGLNADGELGIGNNTGPSICGSVACALSPVAVPLPSGTTLTAISAGAAHALALTSAGAVLAWGENNSGQLGTGNMTQQNSPVAIATPAGTTFAAVSAGHFFGLALTTGGAVYSWGENSVGELGIGTTTGQPMPTLVSLPPAVAIAAGSQHALALTATGQVYAWGGNFDAQLGQGSITGPSTCNSSTPCSTTPVLVPLPGGATARAIVAGNYFSLAIVGTPPGLGYWLGASDGGVFAEGNAPFYGSLGNLTLNKPIVGMAATPGGQGYWLVASDGGVFTEGNAQFYGSLGNLKLNAPIVGMAATPDGRGYWLVASDGGIFAEGDAQFYGSAGALHLNQPVVGIAATADGAGYWLAAADGGIFNYGDAGFFGSPAQVHLNKPVVGIAATPSGLGYWMVASDGGIFNYGDALFFGSTGNLTLNKPVVGIAHSPSGRGYWLVASDGGIFSYGDAGFFGSTGNLVLNKPIVAMATP